MWYTEPENMVRPFQHKTILVFTNSVLSNSDRAKLEGIYDSATRHGWHIQVFAGAVSAKDYLRLLREWQPAGCIVDGRLRKTGAFPPRVSGVPVVQLGNSYGVPPLRDNIGLDSRAIAREAADILTKRTSAGFAYVSAPGHPPWSQARCGFFCEHLRAAGLACDTLTTLSAQNVSGNMKSCISFLKRLRKPANVMLACDDLAPLVYAAARKLRLKIPEDLNIISVDNNPSICQNLSPALSSIEPDFRNGAFKACERLDARTNGRKGRLPRLKYGIAAIALRQSSASTGQAHCIKAAQDWILRHANEPIRVPDVVSVMGYRRRRAEQLFADATGRTIAAAIEDARFANVTAALRGNSLRISAIAALCGFSSPSYLAAAFRRRYGKSISEWKRDSAEPPGYFARKSRKTARSVTTSG